MNYEDAMAWLYSTQGAGIKLGLENIQRLCDAVGFSTSTSNRGPRIIHVAGTNGKGSVCAMLDAICRAAKLRTGLFTSPHLITFRERIRLDGVNISEDEVASGLVRIRESIATWEHHPTFFEITTALALAWFQEHGAEVIILETGLGGRLDSTNVVTPAVSVLTAISFDHREFLGDTLQQIAAEKAGIIKPRVPVISGPQPPEVEQIFENVATQCDSPLQWITEPASYEVALPGSHQKINAAIAVAALKAAQIAVTDEAIEAGLGNLIWPGRFQRITGPAGTPLILDGAHNAAAIERLVQTWREVCGGDNPVILLSVLRSKDVIAICRKLAPLAAAIVVTPVQSNRSCSVEELVIAVQESIPDVPCSVANSVEEGMAEAEAIAQREQRTVLVTGSLFLIGEALALIEGGKQEISAQ